MARHILAVVVAIIALGSSSGAFAASANSASTAGASIATVIAPITLVHTADASINFGRFTVGSGGGKVSVSPASLGTTTGDVTFVPGSTVSADQFSVTGEPGRSFGIGTPDGSITNGTKTIPFSTGAASLSGTINPTGGATFSIGAILTLSGTEPTGTYSGSYTVTVGYQ